AVGIGALAIGDIKYKTEIGMFKEMIDADEPVYLDFRAAYRLAQDLTK
ncbi:MAG: methylenetetrahydromethanopterin dehydrogenase, partial [Pseudomonadota bacterium]